MTARKASARGRRSRSGCLETTALVLFAIVLGAFAASTWMRHLGGGEESAGTQPAAPADSLSSARALERGRIRVQVRNGSGIPGAAGEVTEYLRDAGFDVVDFGNAEEFDEPRTVVIDRVGARDRALEVAAALRGVPVRSEVDTTLYLDVTVLVGRDAGDLLESGRAGSRDTPGWRRWLRRLRGLLP
ncbi:MAG TPA: LytR C-terminal domain-containing protein [Gemmatimonadota bacterium]|nr:LytR C-terminal domain-containing protein [Gemmatimonadota bacterium]